MLQIPRAKVEDAGRYTCVAVNEAGEDSLQYDVRVLCEFVLLCLLCILSKVLTQKYFEELMYARCHTKHLKDYKRQSEIDSSPRSLLFYAN